MSYRVVTALDATGADVAIPDDVSVLLPDGRRLDIEKWSVHYVGSDDPVRIEAVCHVIRANGDVASAMQIDAGDLIFPDKSIFLGDKKLHILSWCPKMEVGEPVRIHFTALIAVPEEKS